MDSQTYLAFVAATAIMIALPGPSVLLTVAHSISFGWKRGLLTVAGATAGIAVQLLVAAIGLVSLLDLVARAFDWLRWAGAAYLIYLGIRQWRSAHLPIELESRGRTGKNLMTHLFTQGMVVTLFNPKSLIFIAAFLPQFMDAARPAAGQLALIVPSFLAITFGVTSVWALAAGNARTLLRGRRAFQSLLKTAGGLMVLAGIGLFLARRP